MIQGKDIFVRASEGEWETTPDGNRRIVCYTDELMMVEFAFEEGGEGWIHSHPHGQSSYVAEGAFDVTIDGLDRDAGSRRQLYRAGLAWEKWRGIFRSCGPSLELCGA